MIMLEPTPCITVDYYRFCSSETQSSWTRPALLLPGTLPSLWSYSSRIYKHFSTGCTRTLYWSTRMNNLTLGTQCVAKTRAPWFRQSSAWWTQTGHRNGSVPSK